MSGSYDRPGMPRRPYAPAPPEQAYAEFYAEEHPATRPPQQPAQPLPPLPNAQQPASRRPPPAGPVPELVAHSRSGEAHDVDPKRTPIVPAGSVTSKSLTLVIAIMCFLACLTAGAVYMINQSAAAWLRDVASEVTVQVEPRDRVDIEKTIRDIKTFLDRQPGIVNVRALSHADSAALLEPWLGQSAEALKALPMPRMIAVELDRNGPPELADIRSQLTRQFPNAVLDDHRQWQLQIRAVTRSFALGGLAILLLVGAATTAIIVSATRSSMASNREIVEVLHYVGATDRFIAREFSGHFLRLGIRAGLVGAIFAMIVFFGLPFVMQMLGGGSVTQAEMSRLIGTGALDLQGYILLGVVVVVIAALCMITSRFGVYRILHQQQ